MTSSPMNRWSFVGSAFRAKFSRPRASDFFDKSTLTVCAPTLAAVHLSAHAFRPSDAAPPLLSFIAGSVPPAAGGPAVLPLSRLDLELWSAKGGRIGLLARLRDVLPGRYSFGVTGRDPTGAVLPAGDYQLRLLAYGTDPGPPTVKSLAFSIK